MTYYAHIESELSQLGIQEGELAIYTGTVNCRQPGTLSPSANSKNAYVYIWQDGQHQELDNSFRCDGAGLDVLKVQTGGEEKYIFLRDKPSGYIHQISGPAKPIIVANLGAIPLRVDTFLGKFTVHAGSVLRLDENAPRREKKKVLLTFHSQYDQPIKSAEIWDGISWRRLNIRKEPFAPGKGRCFAVLDGSAIVQYMEVNVKQEILMLDSPEPDPDYEIYVAAQWWDEVKLCFNRSDYQDGQVVRRTRTVPYGEWVEPVFYDIQKLRESPVQNAVKQCTAELPGYPDGSETPGLITETRPPDGRTEDFAPKGRWPLNSDKLWEFLGGGDESGEQLLKPGQVDMEGQGEDQRSMDAVLGPRELSKTDQDGQKVPVPEPPENFPE